MTLKVPEVVVTGPPNPRLIAHAAGQLAREHQQALVTTGTMRPLLDLLAGSGVDLTRAYDTIATAAARGQPPTPGGHWFLDNFYLVRDARREVLKEIRSGRFFRTLPRLAAGPFQGYPRAFVVTELLVDLVDNAVDRSTLVTFLTAYQAESPLSIAELWALPTMMRISLIRRLQRLATRVRETHVQQRTAVEWAERIGEAALRDPADGLMTARELWREAGDAPNGLLLKVIEALPSAGSATGLAAEWFERELARRGGSVQDIVRSDTQRQISVGNAFTALRWTGSARWGRIVEAASSLERVLRRDPTGVYHRMDFETRDRYRHRVEELAKYSALSEADVARRLLEVTRTAIDEGQDGADAGPGYHLLGDGARAFENVVGYRPPFAHRVRRFAGRWRGELFAAAIASTTLLTGALLLDYARGRGATSVELILLGAAAFLPVLDLAIAFTHRLVAWTVPPRPLPKMDAERGLDEGDRALVVVPTIIRDAADALAQVEHLEIHARANPSPLLRFALLTDFPDADEKTRPGEAETLAAARAAVDELNDRDGDAWGDRFFVLHRDRQWNAAEGVWMGWERKRGKLEELNELLRDPHAETSYHVVAGDFGRVIAGDAIRYVLTLDADTQLPPGAALDLIRTAAHPLNRPRFDARAGRVTRGYGILQPRVAISPRHTFRSTFSRIFSGHVGLDPYTTAVSDVYQDLFHDGIFTGKGLYDVDAFRAALADAVPPDTVLSHDLLEGSHARAALVTDIEVFDDYPSTYLTYSKRLHRWVRGDWQIAPWLLPRVRRRDGSWGRNPLTLLSRWRILDNLRRSLTPAAMLAFLLVGWVVPVVDPVVWTAAALAILAFPVYVNLTTAIFKRPRYATWLSHFDGISEDLGMALVQTGLTLVFLPHLAWTGLDAAARASWRMTVSRRRLLEWTTASDAEARTPNSLDGYVRTLWVAAAWAVVAGVLVGVTAPAALPAALPFLLAWAAAPWVAWRLSRRPQRRREYLAPADAEWLRAVAHRTWAFFDRFMGPETSWLPPDNVQVTPFRGVAGRTSPTNIGLGFLALQAARDFGWIGPDDMLARLARGAAAVDALEHRSGHLLNWYSTSDGSTLWPRYVSTVDSGNFVASLVTLGAGLAELPRAPLWDPARGRGLRDHVRLLAELVEESEPELPAGPEVHAALRALERAAATADATDPLAWRATLLGMREPTRVVVNATRGPEPPAEAEEVAVPSGTDPKRDQALRAQRLRPRADAALRLARIVDEGAAEVDRLLPWLTEGREVPAEVRAAATLEELGEALTAHLADPAARRAVGAVERRKARTTGLREWCRARVDQTDFRVLYDAASDLFSIGFNLETLELDAGHYDLLASEARLASFLAIAKGDVPVDHWFRLGRTAGDEGGGVLLSWGGTMFEYLMPPLLTGSWEGTLLAETYDRAVDVQMDYGARTGVPWGISESAYNSLNLELDYQYRAFGVPGLGLRRGLSEDLVVAPYASAIAAMIRPASAAANLRRLAEEGALGAYGFYDAVDYTPERLPQGRTRSVVATWMAHHQAMTLLAFANILDGRRFQRRFQASALSRSAELLMQERIPRRVETTDPHPMETSVDPGSRDVGDPPVAYVPPERLQEPSPRGQFLSNGRYTTFVTQAGTGFSRYRDWELTRWEPDRVSDPLGWFLYLRDRDSGRVWSAHHLPTRPAHDRLDTWHHLSKVESALVHDWIEAYVEVGVSPEDDVEVRRLTLTNYGDTTRHLDVTSYMEVVLNRTGADRAHPAFSKLFVETEALPELGTLLASRRPRREGDHAPWLFHSVVDHRARGTPTELEFETDRARFVGRGRSLARPAALDGAASLSGTAGPVLDPIFALRRSVELGPREKVVLSFTLGVAEDRTAAVAVAERYAEPATTQRALELAAAYGPAELQHLGIREMEALRYQELAAAIVHADPRLRAPADVLAANVRQQAGLWAYGISGDLPIVVLAVSSMDEVERVEEMMRAAHFWRLRGLRVDVVFLNEHPPSYAEGLQDRITATIESGRHRLPGADARGSSFVLRADQLPPEDRTLIATVAHAFFRGRLPSGLPEALQPAEAIPADDDPTPPARPWGDDDAASPAGPAPKAIAFDNGYGGFLDDGRYEIRVPVRAGRSEPPPLPWVNVVANPGFGFVAGSEGGGYTWSVNSRENRLTPWTNDPVLDRPGEALWLRDDTRGRYASLTPSPTPAGAGYRTVHGFGHTEYHAAFGGIETQATLFVAREDPVKFVRVRLRNGSAETRDLSLFRWQEWVLGVFRSESARYVVTRRDEETGALLARNGYNQEFAGRVAFTHVVGAPGAWECTADRASFLGRNRPLARPRAVEEDAVLVERRGAGLDPCAAYRVALTLAPGEERTVTFLLGEGETEAAVRDVVRRFASPDAVDAELEAVAAFWHQRLGRLRIRTPDPAWNRLLDGWLLYQTLACRMWGRSAFYQSGGAFGFRDQLQDSMAMVYVDPSLTRRQILLHAAHQFVEGDVLHWWHPPTGRGIRSRFSDDLLWLPWVTAFYVGATGDAGVLDERAGYLTARPLEEGEDEAYLVPTPAPVDGTVYDHCCRTLDRSLTSGRHGLPLMGSGDWNDGMNRVGTGGDGESVWLGFFLHRVLEDFLPLCDARGDRERADRYRRYLDDLARALNDAGWDGDWYRRAFYDDGTPLGSAENAECRIDAIAQAWSVLSGVAPPERARAALDAAHRHLVDREGGLVRLLTPPFDRTPKDPGYIKGYLPGVRENGGQYTHGVLWLVQAMAESGDPDRAADLYGLMNPVRHAADGDGARRYGVEPYVAVADVYSVPPHVGRGGWSWYTGSGAWMYRVALESILGFRLEAGAIRLAPRPPSGWSDYEVDWTDEAGVRWAIRVERVGPGTAVDRATVDGREVALAEDGSIVISAGAGDGGAVRRVEVRLGRVD